MDENPQEAVDEGDQSLWVGAQLDVNQEVESGLRQGLDENQKAVDVEATEGGLGLGLG